MDRTGSCCCADPITATPNHTKIPTKFRIFSIEMTLLMDCGTGSNFP